MIWTFSTPVFSSSCLSFVPAEKQVHSSRLIFELLLDIVYATFFALLGQNVEYLRRVYRHQLRRTLIYFICFKRAPMQFMHVLMLLTVPFFLDKI